MKCFLFDGRKMFTVFKGKQYHKPWMLLEDLQEFQQWVLKFLDETNAINNCFMLLLSQSVKSCTLFDYGYQWADNFNLCFISSADSKREVKTIEVRPMAQHKQLTATVMPTTSVTESHEIQNTPSTSAVTEGIDVFTSTVATGNCMFFSL